MNSTKEYFNKLGIYWITKLGRKEQLNFDYFF